jgi:lysyl-tRNA synthetase class 2
MIPSQDQDPAVNRKSNLIRRARILRELRRIMDERGYLEVETPLRVRTPGTDVNLEAFSSEERYLITSPEFHMKRLLAEGFMRIYQMGRCFRRGELTDLHNPEFTMLEFYAAGLSLEGMMKEIEEILGKVAAAMPVGEVHFGEASCDLRSPWTRLSVDAAFRQYAGWSPLDAFDEERFYFDLVDKVDRHLGRERPTILFHYPAPLAMLAQLHPGDVGIARRFEVYIAGVEIANAFEELTDSQEQRRRFEADLERRRQQGKSAYPIDEEFLEAVGEMPPCSGIAVGVDRLVMLLLGTEKMSEVMAFPEAAV